MSGYIPVTEPQKTEMLNAIGVKSIDGLFDVIPEPLRLKKPLDLPQGVTEFELEKHMRGMADRNISLSGHACFLGAGAYDHYIPSAVKHIVSKPEFYTAYTPYQPEISQGMLQAIFEYQTMICSLTGMGVSNASMYDGSTALAEAALMACSVTGRNTVLVPKNVHPEYRKVLKTYGEYCGFEVVETEYETDSGKANLEDIARKLSGEVAAVMIQTPNFFGVVEDSDDIPAVIGASGSLFVACADPISLAILKPPAGADIVVGEGQPLGNPLAYGGPYLGFFAAKSKYLRKMPGRIVGKTLDSEGKTAYVLTIQAREQHIRREKATSNICSNQALNALTAAAYMTVMGPGGIRTAAQNCVSKSSYALKKLLDTGSFTQVFKAPFFREFVVKSPAGIDKLNERLFEKGIIGGLDLGRFYPELQGCWLVAVTEKRTAEEIDVFAQTAGEVCENG